MSFKDKFGKLALTGISRQNPAGFRSASPSRGGSSSPRSPSTAVSPLLPSSLSAPFPSFSSPFHSLSSPLQGRSRSPPPSPPPPPPSLEETRESLIHTYMELKHLCDLKEHNDRNDSPTPTCFGPRIPVLSKEEKMKSAEKMEDEEEEKNGVMTLEDKVKFWEPKVDQMKEKRHEHVKGYLTTYGNSNVKRKYEARNGPLV
ncbi:hypothetical protein AALP_AAs74908U000400 [Arabis alpina]|uniref:Uncharacterized protein n=1 Tax=Arabis alpina TaxID=50452 RepID=A0A087G217_ARAAL|nr:hypothetical protein AALP_AAs74908U000400 [Arabis alpina]